MSTERVFDPRTSSVFYDCSKPSTVSTSSSYTQQLVENAVPSPLDRGHDAIRPDMVPTNNNLPAHQYVLTNHYSSFHEQVEQLEYVPQYAGTTRQQREDVIRRTAEVPVHFVPVLTYPDADHCYSRTSTIYPEQSHISTSSTNVTHSTYSPMLQNQQTPQNYAIHQHIEDPIANSLYYEDFQPQIVYSAPQETVKQGMQYGKDTMRVRYERNDDIHYTTGVSPTYASTSSINRQSMVTEQHPQLRQHHFPVNNIAESPYHINYSPMQDTINGGEIDDTNRQRRSKRRLTEFVDDGVYTESVQTQKKKPARRKKCKFDDDGTEFQPVETNNDQPHAPLTHGELLKQKKKNMAFPKGTFLIRYADLDSDEYAGHIWLVDNHQLLQKYTYDGIDANNLKIFSRTERYSGWLCNRPWLYHPLYDVKVILGNMEKVSIRNHPTRDELLARREEESRRAPEIEPEQLEAVGEAGVSDAEHSSEEHEQDTLTREEFEDEMCSIKVEVDDIP